MSRARDGFTVGEHKANNVLWSTADKNSAFLADSTQHAQLAVLMDIRAELGTLNKLLHCSNFTKLPAEIRGLRRDLKALAKAILERGPS